MAANSTTAAQQVFEIAELLEHILSFLEIRELLRCQQACVSFRSITRTSTRIRKKLYLLASKTSVPVEGTEKHIQDPKKPVYNPLLWNFQGLWADSRYNRETGEHILQLHALCSTMREPAMLDGSWRSMLVSQPPVKTRVFVEIHRPGVRRHWQSRYRVTDLDRPTMGDLVDELRSFGVLL